MRAVSAERRRRARRAAELRVILGGDSRRRRTFSVCAARYGISSDTVFSAPSDSATTCSREMHSTHFDGSSLLSSEVRNSRVGSADIPGCKNVRPLRAMGGEGGEGASDVGLSVVGIVGEWIWARNLW